MPTITRRAFVFACLAAVVVPGAASIISRDAVTGVPSVTASRPDSLPSALRDSLARARQDSINRSQPGYVVDSIRPLAEEIRRFRELAGTPTSAFEGGTRSQRELIQAFAIALEQSDSSALNRLTISMREFAYLVYPSSPYVKAPYRQPPGLLWRTIAGPSVVGRARLLHRMGGHPLSLSGLSCDTAAERQGDNVLHPNCRVDIKQPDGAIVRRRLFGSIIERHGRFKFISLQNDI
ncbi:MAG: hypothetical protein U0132_03770 [Gemmatimonadaceae bacterium]